MGPYTKDPLHDRRRLGLMSDRTLSDVLASELRQICRPTQCSANTCEGTTSQLPPHLSLPAPHHSVSVVVADALEKLHGDAPEERLDAECVEDGTSGRAITQNLRQDAPWFAIGPSGEPERAMVHEGRKECVGHRLVRRIR
jgi:hypothetical protein